MPVPQENSLFVEQASCLFLRMVQDVSLIRDFRCPIQDYQKNRVQECNSYINDQEFLDGTSPRIYPWNQSQIANRKSSSPRIYPWGQSKI